MRNLRLPLLLTLTMLFASACATPEGGAGAGGVSRDMISMEELQAGGFNNLHEAVQRLRPQWLVLRGQGSVGSDARINVYQDNMRIGDVDALRQMSAVDVRYIRFYDGMAATSRFGLDNANGVIMVSTRPL